jgi:hypothetical protein
MDTVPFADLRSYDESFATIDYSEASPLLFAGSSSTMTPWRCATSEPSTSPPGPAHRGIQSTVALLSSCAPEPHPVGCVHVMRSDSRPERSHARHPAGERPRVRSPRRSRSGAAASCATTGRSDRFQRRSIDVTAPSTAGTIRAFDPYQGFRYLSEYQGHWSEIRSIHALPSVWPGRPLADYGDRTFRHFQSALASTDFVLGEFPRVEVHDRVDVADCSRRSCCPGRARRVKPIGRSASISPVSRSGRRSARETADPIGSLRTSRRRMPARRRPPANLVVLALLLLLLLGQRRCGASRCSHTTTFRTSR